MNGSFFPLQLGIAVALILLVAASTIRFVVRATRAGAEPIIRATFRELQKGWYQVHIAVANQAPYGVAVDELRRARPRSARLMAPIKSVSGDASCTVGAPADIAAAEALRPVDLVDRRIGAGPSLRDSVTSQGYPEHATAIGQDAGTLALGAGMEDFDIRIGARILKPLDLGASRISAGITL